MEDNEESAEAGYAAGSGSGSQDNVGETLLTARKRLGLSREDVAAQTRIAERHLVAIEENRFGDLAGKTYAVGFSRAYAKAVGLDESVIADRVREQIAPRDYQPRPATSFEPGDPARVPPSGLAWIAGIAAIGVFVALFFVWDSLFSPEAELPSLIADAPEATASAVAVVQPASTAAPAQRGGVVAMKAMAPNVWVKITDAAGNQLFQKELSQGEVYTVPTDAEGPLLRTGRPDALELTIDGRPLPRLEDRPIVVSDVPLSADLLRARLAGTTALPTPGAGAAASAPAPASTETAARAAASAPEPRTTPSARTVPAPIARSSAGVAQRTVGAPVPPATRPSAPRTTPQTLPGAGVAAEAAAPEAVSTDSE